MNDIEQAVKGIALATAAQKIENGDYLGEDGLLYCGNCHTPRQCRVNLGSGEILAGCLCKCRVEAYNAEEERRKHEQELLKIAALRSEGIQDKSLRDAKFETAENSPQLERCREYAQKFSEIKEIGGGFLLWGNPGTGKTFAAACIANHLIDTGRPVLMTSFPRILNSPFEREEIARQMRRYELVVIDDLGVERQSPMALETVYYIIDERYKSKLPMIVTTNLQIQEIQNPSSMTYKRIYSRVLEMCTPMGFDGKIHRKKQQDNRADALKRLLARKD